MQISKRRDVATVISLLPVRLEEKKPGLYPGTYIIPAVTERGGFNCLIINEAVHYVPQLEHAPYQAVTPPGEIAKSIVSDYNEAVLGRGEDAEPGLFWTYGEYSRDLAKIELRDEIHKAAVQQRNWFVNLVRIADIEWAKAPNNHNVITDLMRHAAKALGLEKEWQIDPENLALIYCPACHNNISSKAVVCGSCGCVVKPEEYKQFQFANVK